MPNRAPMPHSDSRPWIGLTLLLLAGGLPSLTGCSAAGEGEGVEGVPLDRLVAVTAVYAEAGSTGAPVQRVVLFDADDPSRYELVTAAGHVNSAAKFGPGKDHLLWEDESSGEVHDAQFTVFDLPHGPPRGLSESIGSAEVELVGRQPVWDAAGAGFYFSRAPRPAAPTPSVLYYGLGSRRARVVAGDGARGGVYPVALISRDTLLVFSGEGDATGGPVGYYYMSPEGRYLGPVENPRLRYVNRDGVTRQGAFDPDWDGAQRLLAVSYVDSTLAGYRVAVTDLEGRVWRELTAGDQIDGHPVWGPGGRTVLFDRRAPFDGSFTGYRAMAVDVVSGQVRALAEPQTFGAVGLRSPDF